MFKLEDIDILAKQHELPHAEVEIYASTALEQCLSEALRMQCFLQPDGSFKASGRTIEQYEFTSAIQRHATFRLQNMLEDAAATRRFEAAIKLENSVVFGECQYHGDRIIVHTTCGRVSSGYRV